MNRHQFQRAARQFRAGKVSLKEFTDRVLDSAPTLNPALPPGLPDLPRRADDCHKNDCGRIVVVGGSRGMAGAAVLAGLGALRSGAGLVTVATARCCQDIVAEAHPALMTVGLPDDEDGRIALNSWKSLEQCLPAFDCLAIGPGLGCAPNLQQLVRDVFSQSPVTTLLDADGLNNLGIEFDWPMPSAARVLTPHPGEFRRIMVDAGHDRETRKLQAGSLALRFEGVVVLKGHRTLITDGRQSHHNQTGNSGMATAGSGDVLTGVIAALVGQGLGAWDAAVLGCHVHGASGDRARDKKGVHGLVATDMIDQLPSVLQSIVSS